MELADKLNSLSSKVKQQTEAIKTEEATKTAFILPFISTVLGYDIFDPSEVVPEYICDVGTKKGEKIDYAIFKNGTVQILIECKKIGESLNLNHASQLIRYFHVTNARIAILTNGQYYKFFTDLDNKNKMDEKPFLEINILDVDENIVPELNKLTKNAFDIESILNAASELKYIGQIKRLLAVQFANPDDDFVRFFSQRVYEGVNTQKVRDQFQTLTRKALSQFLNDQINERLKNAITGISQPISESELERDADGSKNSSEDGIITTQEELDGFLIIKAIARKVVEPERVFHRDAKSYFSIILDDNNRRPICRLYLNSIKKQIGLFDAAKIETKFELKSLDDVYDYADQILSTINSYLT